MLKVLGATVAVALASVTFAAIACWPTMIALGIFHSYFHRVPALGLWASGISVLAVRTLIPTGGKSSDT